MKSVRFLLPLLLLLYTFSLCGCTSKEEKKIEDAVKQELDQLKDLDSITTQKYISYQELFPGEPRRYHYFFCILKKSFLSFSRILIIKFWMLT